MCIDSQSKYLRIITRKNFKVIINHVIEVNLSRGIRIHNKNHEEVCVFCSSTQNLTKEHVIPRWAFEGSTKKFFITNINGLPQTYNKTTIPACSVCNNEILNAFEVYINELFEEINLETSYFYVDEIENIIRWLEIVDYKFQILNVRRLYLKSKEKGYIHYLADFPLTVLRPQINYSPSKSVTGIRRSLKRLTIKSKQNNVNSLIVFETSNTSFHFFHTMDEFIFIELPQYRIALFYFYKKIFSTLEEAKIEAMKIIDTNYN
jgi:hypothetical protein